MDYFNLFIEGFLTAIACVIIFYAIPRWYKIGERKKKEHIHNKKVYYGIFRMIGLYILALISSEMVLLILLGNREIEGLIALSLVFVVSIPVMFLYLFLYRRHYYEMINDHFNTKRE